jgi:hypothetical protein
MWVKDRLLLRQLNLLLVYSGELNVGICGPQSEAGCSHSRYAWKRPRGIPSVRTNRGSEDRPPVPLTIALAIAASLPEMRAMGHEPKTVQWVTDLPCGLAAVSVGPAPAD